MIIYYIWQSLLRTYAFLAGFSKTIWVKILMLQSQNVKVIGLFYWHYLCHATKLQMGVFCCIYTVGENTNR